MQISFDKSINPDTFKRVIGSDEIRGYKVYLIVRDPVKRYVSFYYNWIVNKDWDFVDPEGNLNHGFHILKQVASLQDYEAFIGLTSKEKQTTQAIDVYTKYLPALHMLDGHTQPQHLIYSNSGSSVDAFTQLVPLSELNQFFVLNFGVELPVKNRTFGKNPEMETPLVMEVCRRVYSRDYDDFWQPYWSDQDR